jgi:hypothetical protein
MNLHHSNKKFNIFFNIENRYISATNIFLLESHVFVRIINNHIEAIGEGAQSPFVILCF